MTVRKSIAGSVLIDVLLAAMLVALMVSPTVSMLITSHKTATQVEQNLNALAMAQSYLEEVLAAGPDAWINQPFFPLPDNPDFKLAVDIKLLPARLYEIHVFIRWGEVPNDQTWELATLATASDW